MAKEHQIGIRVDDETKAALSAAAKAESRAVSDLIRIIIKEWLAKNASARKGRKP